jgi:predicted site-specific integrase-resolvase
VESYLGCERTQENNKKKIIYARVSSNHQKEDLQRQIQDLQAAYSEHQTIQDIGSGLNFKRKGLQTILEQTMQGSVSEVVVMHRDRLCRYGIEIIEQIFSQTRTKLVVHCKAEGVSSQQELAGDLLAITTIFVARHNGQRSAANRKRRRNAQSAQNQGVSDFRAETST